MWKQACLRGQKLPTTRQLTSVGAGCLMPSTGTMAFKSGPLSQTEGVSHVISRYSPQATDTAILKRGGGGIPAVTAP